MKRRTRGIKVGGARPGDLPPLTTVTPPPVTSYYAPMTSTTIQTQSYPSPTTLNDHNDTTSQQEPISSFIPAGMTMKVPESKTLPASTKTEAEEAAHRAEQFMASMQQQSTITPTQGTAMKSPGSSFAPPVDVELETAKKAAEAAQARLTKEKVTTMSSFKWFGGPRSWGSGSSHGKQMQNTESDLALDSKVENMARELGGTMNSAVENGDDNNKNNEVPKEESTMERIMREQEQIKQAMAQRHAFMEQQEEDKGFVPEMLRPTPPPPPTAPVVVESPPPKTPKEELEHIFFTFSCQVKKAMDGVGRLRQQRNMLLDERYVALAKERLAIQQIAQAELQQVAAAEADDYEVAERLQVIIEGHTRDKGELSAILDNIGRALTQLDTQTPGVVGAVSACFADVDHELKFFLAKQSSSDKEYGAEAQKRFQAVARQLSVEEDRIKQELKHIERDEDLAIEERKELDRTILEQTAEMEECKDDAIRKLEYVQQEIIFLRKQLAEKESDVVRLQNEVGFQEQNISKVRVQFTRQLQRVQKKESSAELNRREWENDKNAYERLRDVHEAEVKSHSEDLLTHTNLMDLLKKEITLASTFREIVSKEIGFDNNRNEEKEADGEMAGLQADVVKCEAAVAEAKQLVKVADAAMISLDYEYQILQSKLPQLEVTKKDAAAARDFKTAGQASKEIKEATMRLEMCEKELAGDAQVRKNEAQFKLEKVTTELMAIKEIADKLEKESGREIMEIIAEKIRKLIQTKRKVCGNGDDASVKGMGAFVLKAQILALKIEGQHYGSKFGGWDEIMEQIDESDQPEPSIQTTESFVSKKEELPLRPSGAIDAELVLKGKKINQKIKDAEEALEAAVASEDYEEAAELDQLFKTIQLELEGLGLTDAEAELVLADKEATFAEEVGTSQEEVASEGLVNTKAELTRADEDTVVKDVVPNPKEFVPDVTTEEPQQKSVATDEAPAEEATPSANLEQKIEGDEVVFTAGGIEEENTDASVVNGAEGIKTTDGEGDEFHDALALGEETENLEDR